MPTVCLAASCLTYPTGGGHLWAYLNWALGLRAAGCDVYWLEGLNGTSLEVVRAHEQDLRGLLEPYGFAERLVTYAFRGGSWDSDSDLAGIAGSSDLLVTIDYTTPAPVVELFPRSVLIDIDPGLLQTWLHDGWIEIAKHDLHFTIGETVGTPEARFPDGGRAWIYTPPCVSLDEWTVTQPDPHAAFTTVSQWDAGEWIGDGQTGYPNNKRDGFLPFLQLPQLVSVPLELALNLGELDRGGHEVVEAGWRFVHAEDVAALPWDYRQYLQGSLGEFSCVKPSCIRMQNAWISDRTICFLGSGKPAVVQHTGPSRILPDDAGILRFQTVDEAAVALETAWADYELHCKLARELAEEHFDAKKVAHALLEKALS